jgi:uncharacterized protein (DUF58 family)
MINFTRVWNWLQKSWQRRRVGPLEYVVRYLYVFKMTRAAKYLTVGVVLASGPALLNLQIPVYQLFVTLALLFAITFIVALVRRPTLNIAGRFPEKVIAGQTATGTYTVTNTGHGGALDVSLRHFWLPRHVIQRYQTDSIAYLEPGASAETPVQLRFERRGLHSLPSLVAFTEFPFNFWRTKTRIDARSREALERGTVIALPDFHPAETIDLPVSSRYQPGGIALTSNVGESPEYIGSREYRPGDSIRRIDFRAWARHNEPAVREYQEEYYCKVALVLDTFIAPDRPATKAGYTELEAAVSLSAAIADALSSGEYIIDIFAAGPELYVFRTGRHTTHFDNVLEILACIGECTENPFEKVAPALVDELSTISTAIFVFLDWDRSREQLVRTALDAGCSVKVFLVRDGDASLPPEGADLIEWGVQWYSPERVHAGGYGTL